MAHMSSILFGDSMARNRRGRPPFGYSVLHKEHNLIRFNHQKTPLT